ncbi:hypothetical protein [Novacetimonas cocois]|uniref:hypothetical protein n=1 Tax=Novacetimonas cocois TaxID=1747507 RepID=UPI0014021C96|nr:hypothetical protein [Novacetimonas cocois]
MTVRERKPVDINQVESLIDMVQRLNEAGIEIPATLSRKTTGLLSRMATDIKKGVSFRE